MNGFSNPSPSLLRRFETCVSTVRVVTPSSSSTPQISSSSSSRLTVRPRCSIRYLSSSNSLNDSATCLPTLSTSRGSKRTSTSPNGYVVVAGGAAFGRPRSSIRYLSSSNSLNDSATCLPTLSTSRGSKRTSTSPN